MLRGPRRKAISAPQAESHSPLKQNRLLTPKIPAEMEPQQKVGEKERLMAGYPSS